MTKKEYHEGDSCLAQNGGMLCTGTLEFIGSKSMLRRITAIVFKCNVCGAIVQNFVGL